MQCDIWCISRPAVFDFNLEFEDGFMVYEVSLDIWNFAITQGHFFHKSLQNELIFGAFL